MYSTGMVLAKPVRNQPRPKPMPATVMMICAGALRCSHPPMGPLKPIIAINDGVGERHRLRREAISFHQGFWKMLQIFNDAVSAPHKAAQIRMTPRR